MRIFHEKKGHELSLPPNIYNNINQFYLIIHSGNKVRINHNNNLVNLISIDL